MNIVQLIQHIENSNTLIVKDDERSLGGAELIKEVKTLSKYYKGVGISDQAMVLLRMQNNVDSVVSLLALLLNKAMVFVGNPFDPLTKTYEQIKAYRPYAVISSKPSAYAMLKTFNEDGSESAVTEQGINNSLYSTIFRNHARKLRDYDSGMSNADIAIFSSGTTGESKAILHGLPSVLLNAEMHNESIGMETDDVLGIVLPVYYSYGLVASLFGGILKEVAIVLHAKAANLDEAWISSNQITVLSITPFFSTELKSSFTSLKRVTLGGDVLLSNQAKALLEKLPDCRFYATFGLTEAGPRVSTWQVDKKMLEDSSSIPLGTPLSGVELFLDNSEMLNKNQGELIVKTPTKMIGYYFGAKGGFQPFEDSQNKLYTGDVFEKRGNQLYFIARKKEIILQGGEKLFPSAIEVAIRGIAGVKDVKVKRDYDQTFGGDIAIARVVSDETVTPRSIRKVLMTKFPKSQIPREIESVFSIARTLTGKVA